MKHVFTLSFIIGLSSLVFGFTDPDTTHFESVPNTELSDVEIKLNQIDKARYNTYRLIPTENDLNIGISPINKELSDSLLTERMAKLNAHSPVEFQNNPIVKREIEKYLNTPANGLGVWMSRSKYYFPLFEEVLYQNKLPLELKILTVLESGLNPHAESNYGAKGLWQLIFTTAKANGLTMSSYVDERADPKLSTIGASKYLVYLYDIYEDWLLALAAYNAGPGNVNKAIRHSGGKWNYWEIRQYLPFQTQDYVPRFMALNYIFTYAKEHNIGMIKPKFYYEQTDTVKVYRNIPLSFISENLDISMDELTYLNPSYLLKIIPGTFQKKYSLVLPVDKVGLWISKQDEFLQKLDDLEKQKKMVYPTLEETNTRIRYTVKNGDYLGKIANKYNVKVASIKKWNNLTNSHKLKIGQRLTIYTKHR